jgi:putative Mg2+ transporter-C (MgtC) family protein
MPGTFLPVLAATGLGALVGLERQFHQGMAGLRTNALVATAAAAFVHLPLAARGDVHFASLAAAVISGIGFLGAGVILREGMNVRGLNTAATLWGSAAIGVYAGSELLWDAAALAAIILGINLLLRPVIARLNRLGAYFSVGAPSMFKATLECTLAGQEAARVALIEQVRKAGLHLRGLRTTAMEGRPDALRLEFDVMGYGRVELTVERIMASMGRLTGVCGYAWSRADAPDNDPSLHPAS